MHGLHAWPRAHRNPSHELERLLDLLCSVKQIIVMINLPHVTDMIMANIPVLSQPSLPYG
jgi:hypothetical protein